jgi:microcystin-dependent protein
MPQKYANNARSKLSSSITSADTSLSVLAGSGDLFPVANAGADTLPSSSDWFKLFITDVSGEIEIVGVRTRASGSDILSSLVRGMDGTLARAWGAGAVAYQAFSVYDLEAAISRAEAAVTAAEVVAEAATEASLKNVGMVGFFPMAAAPDGWLEANGAAVSRTTYAALFAKIGTTSGVGDGSTTFNLPDLRGEFVRGLDNGRGVDVGRAIGSSQADGIKSHSHTTSFNRYNDGNSLQASALSASGSVSQGVVAMPSSSTGGAETRPRNIALLACIKH